MKQDRRTFLKTASVAGVAAATGLPAATAARAQATAPASSRAELPKGLTFATLRGPDGYGLGLRTDRGVLNVAAAEHDFREGAPTSIDAVFKGGGDISGLNRLVAKARASATPDRYFIPVDKAPFGPCVTNPEKIVCIGLNYRKHAAETGNPVPKQPILFNKFNTALNDHGGTINVSKEDGHPVRLRGRARDRHRPHRPQCQRGRRAEYIFGYCTGNDFTARDLQRRSSQWMLGKSARRFGADRPLAGHCRPGRRR